MPETKASVEAVQKACNEFTDRFLPGVKPLVVDGKKGKATNTRIRTCKFYLGYGRSDVDSKVTRAFLTRLANPHRKTANPTRATGIRRRAAYKARHALEGFKATVAPGVTKFDGVPCAVWIAKELARIRGAGRWKGKLVSGWRSPAYSRSLCIARCGAPSCPGTCAGASSNHSGSKYPAGACDVSDYVTFEKEAIRLKSPLINRLDSRDPVHFSVSGR